MKFFRFMFSLILVLILLLNNTLIYAISFNDVQQDSWYSEAVDFVSEKKWMIGTSETEFSPNMSLSRAMFVTVLYRFAGSPNGYYPNAFVDVAETDYYAKAVSWAHANNIVNGTSNSTFSPYRNITREEMVTILYRYAQHHGFDTTSETTLTDFSDYNNISDYAINAMIWAVASNLVKGTSDTLLSPQSQTNRAQCATIIWRFYNQINKELEIDCYNVKDYGAVGDGITDDTEAINKVIEKASDGSTIYFPEGTYLVSASNKYSAIRINNKNNLTLLLSESATIKHATANSEYYYIIHIQNCNKITVTGGNIEGEADTHPYREDTIQGNIHGYGIRLADSTNTVVKNVNIFNCYGDGICISSDSYPNIGCDGVLIENCEIHDILRNGITISSCRDIRIINCDIYNISGANPMAGIDIEAEHTGSINNNIIIDGCQIKGENYSIAASLVADNITLINSKLSGYMPIAKDISNMKISNCVLDSLGIQSMDSIKIQSSTLRSLLLCGGNCNVQNCDFIPDSNTASNVNIYQPGGNATFINCNFKTSDIQESSFFNIRNNKIADSLLFENCSFDTNCQKYGIAISGTMNNAKFSNCIFKNSHSTWTTQWLQMTANNLIIQNCTFDASTLLDYQNYSSLIKLNATNLSVENCEIKIGENIPCKYAFSSIGDIVTGDISYIGNIVPGWTTLGRMPTNANFVAYGNLLNGKMDNPFPNT